MKSKLLLLLLTITNLSFSQESWRPLGPNDFNQSSFGKVNYTKIKTDNNNVIYTAYSDEYNGNKLTVRKFINNEWEVVGNIAISSGEANYVSLDIDNNNIPYVAYQDVSNSSKVTVQKFDGSNWVNVGNVGFSSNTANDISIVIGQDNTPYISYQDSSLGNKATVQKFNGSIWEFVGNAGISLNQADYLSLEIINTTPYIVYSNTAVVNKATVQKFDGSNWVFVGSQGLTPGQATYTTIKSDNSGVPYILYRDGSQNNKATMEYYDGTDWLNVGQLGFTSDSVKYLSFDFDSNNIPYIVARIGEGLVDMSVYKYENSNWSIIPSIQDGVDLADGDVEFCSISIDNNDMPNIIYKDIENRNVSTVKRFNENIELVGDWEFLGDEPFTKSTTNIQTLVDSNGDMYVLHHEFFYDTITIKKYSQSNISQFGVEWIQIGGIIGYARYDTTSFAIDSNNKIYVSFANDNTGGSLTVKTFENGNWVTVSNTGLPTSTIFYTSIDVDSNNEPYIVYKENSSFAIKKFSQNSWVNIGNFNTGGAFYHKIKIDKNNSPNIIYISYLTSSNRAKVLRYINSNWEDVDNSTINSSNFLSDITIQINSNIPYICYQDRTNDVITMKYFNGTSWDDLGNINYVVESGSPLMKFSNNIPYIIYRDAQDKASVIRYNNNSWETVGISNFSAGKGGSPSIDFVNGIPIAVYSGDKGCFAKYYGTESVLSIKDIPYNINTSVNIFPNPTSDILSIKSDKRIEKIEIYNISGQYVMSINDDFKNIDVNKLNTGMYLIKVYFDGNSQTIKMIKQ